ncbi:hypothetical protein CHH83_02015 [Bacillus sp. 7586-K]|nr:hypothetical protein CHH83_02015 [Bacillus sp. 7586-K]
MRKGELSSPFKLIAIKTKNKVLISDNIDGSSYFYSKIQDYLIDGKTAKNTYKSDWFQLDNLPVKIEKKIPAKKINQRYELREGFQETDLTPKVINESYIDEDSEYYEVKGLYELKYETTEPTYEEIEFEINIIEEIEEDFEITRQDFDYKYNLLDRIQTHPVLLPTKPCSLSREESYRIIRNHVKANIDPKYAAITSDYDFCFTVVKKIELYKPKQYEVNINQGTRRKPKYQTRFNTNRTVTVFETAPKPYQNYSVCEPFTGKNVEDLNNNIKLFLDELMEKINEPFVECPHCKGNGVVLDGNN